MMMMMMTKMTVSLVKRLLLVYRFPLPLLLLRLNDYSMRHFSYRQKKMTTNGCFLLRSLRELALRG
jgi:hypothetical protein